ncbi:hypothetical protein [Marinitoga lauensis]|uniref:hypothetical protein n=1 Tax=Marinitoga lauensis TaxID=2201189 RepID=UPI001010F106|nr:hypothetical protein [Marinitoga lauensis]
MLNVVIQNFDLKGIVFDNKLYGEKGDFIINIPPDIKVFSDKKLTSLEIITLKNALTTINNENLKNFRFKSGHILEILELINSNFKLETVLKLTEDALRKLLNSDGLQSYYIMKISTY